MKKRFMLNPEKERRISDGALWFLAGCLIVILLTSCSPYAATVPIGTPTPSPSATATAASVNQGLQTPTPRPSCTVTGFLNLRTRPSRSAAVIRVLEAGEVVTVLDAGTWNKVTTGNQAGYIYGRYCR